MSAISDARYNNQRLYCEKHNVPLFAPQTCSHYVRWGDYHEAPKDIFEVIDDITSMSTHIISCPICHKSFCD